MFLFFCFNSRRTNKVEDGFSSKRCLTWFKQYTTTDEPDVLGPDAMEQFCKDIGVEPENVVMLGMENISLKNTETNLPLTKRF